MTDHGMKIFESRKEYKHTSVTPLDLPTKFSPSLHIQLQKNSKAWNNFTGMTSSCQNQYIRWVMSAKRTATIQKRMKEAIQLLEENQKLGMK